jgi:hypothetical protein
MRGIALGEVVFPPSYLIRLSPIAPSLKKTEEIIERIVKILLEEISSSGLKISFARGEDGTIWLEAVQKEEEEKVLMNLPSILRDVIFIDKEDPLLGFDWNVLSSQTLLEEKIRKVVRMRLKILLAMAGSKDTITLREKLLRISEEERAMIRMTSIDTESGEEEVLLHAIGGEEAQ